jgi:elongation factor G
MMAPFAGDRAYRFAWDVPDGMLPLLFMEAAALQGVKDALSRPVQAGGRVAHVCVSVVNGSYHHTDTDEVAVRVAASMAVMNALSRATLAQG